MRRLALAVGLALCIAPSCLAEAEPGEDPFAKYLFSPERVIGHARDIGLDDSQKARVRDEVQKAQPKFLDAQFSMQEAMGRLTPLLQEKTVDEARVLAEIDKVLALEREVKRLQISMLVRIKNILTPAQQARLAEFPAGPGR